jgi:hypothetical protein
MTHMGTARLRRPFEPSVTKDSDIPGFALHVTRTRTFWALSYQPKGVNPSTGKRWGGGVRHELGDAMLVPVSEARTLALTARALVRAGEKPPPRKTSLHSLRCGPASRPAIDRR